MTSERKPERRARHWDACMSCGGPVEASSQRKCDACKARTAEQRRERVRAKARERRAAEAAARVVTCADCGGVRKAGHTICADCRARKRKERRGRENELRRARRAAERAARPGPTRDEELAALVAAQERDARWGDRNRFRTDSGYLIYSLDEEIDGSGAGEGGIRYLDVISEWAE